MTIQNKNIREEVQGFVELGGAALIPMAPSTTGVLFQMVAKKHGKLKAATFMVAAAATTIGSTALDTLKLQKRGITGAVTAVDISVTAVFVNAAAAPQINLPSGTLVRIPGLGGNRVVQGEIIDVVWTETGTPPSTRPTMSFLGAEFEYDSNISPSLP